jgi:hypothetical protein
VPKRIKVMDAMGPPYFVKSLGCGGFIEPLPATFGVYPTKYYIF